MTHVTVCMGIQPSKLVHQVHAAEGVGDSVEPPKSNTKSVATLLVLPR
jgi:hypothetical protein